MIGGGSALAAPGYRPSRPRRSTPRMTDTPVEVIRAALLAGVPHGFLGRLGGVSQGVCAGLNVGHGSGDDPASIDENRRRAVAAVAPGAALVTLHQVHSGQGGAGAEPRATAARQA